MPKGRGNKMPLNKNREFIDPAGELRRITVRIVLNELQMQHMRSRIDDAAGDEDKLGGKYEIEEFLNIPYMNRSEVALGICATGTTMTRTTMITAPVPVTSDIAAPHLRLKCSSA